MVCVICYGSYCTVKRERLQLVSIIIMLHAVQFVGHVFQTRFYLIATFIYQKKKSQVWGYHELEWTGKKCV